MADPSAQPPPARRPFSDPGRSGSGESTYFCISPIPSQCIPMYAVLPYSTAIDQRFPLRLCKDFQSSTHHHEEELERASTFLPSSPLMRIRHRIQRPASGGSHRALDPTARLLLLRRCGIRFLHVRGVRFLLRRMTDGHANANLWKTKSATLCMVAKAGKRSGYPTYQRLQRAIAVVGKIVIEPHHARLKQRQYSRAPKLEITQLFRRLTFSPSSS